MLTLENYLPGLMKGLTDSLSMVVTDNAAFYSIADNMMLEEFPDLLSHIENGSGTDYSEWFWMQVLYYGVDDDDNPIWGEQRYIKAYRISDTEVWIPSIGTTAYLNWNNFGPAPYEEIGNEKYGLWIL